MNIKGVGKLMILPGVLAVVVLVGVYLVSGGSMDGSGIKVTEESGALTEEKVDDVVEDGVYTNYKYGFSFEYPTGVFTEYELVRSLEETSYSAKFNDAVAGMKDISMLVFVGSEEGLMDSYTKYEKQPLGVPEYSDDYLNTVDESEWPFNNTIKIEDVKVGNNQGFIVYSRFIGYKLESEPTHLNSFYIQKDDKVILISIVSWAGENFADDYKVEREEILEDVVNTFKFF